MEPSSRPSAPARPKAPPKPPRPPRPPRSTAQPKSKTPDLSPAASLDPARGPSQDPSPVSSQVPSQDPPKDPPHSRIPAKVRAGSPFRRHTQTRAETPGPGLDQARVQDPGPADARALPQALLELVSCLHDHLGLGAGMDLPEPCAPLPGDTRRRLESALEGLENPDAGLAACHTRVRRLLAGLPMVKAVELEDDDLNLLALLFAAFLDGDGSQRVVCLLRAIRPEGAECLGLLGRIRALVDHRLLALDDDRPLPGRTRSGDTGLVGLVSAWVALHPDLLARILEPEPHAPREDSAPEAGNARFLTGLLAYSQVLRRTAESDHGEARVRQERGKAWEQLLEHAAGGGMPLPFLELVDSQGLDARERDGLVYLLDEHLQGMDCLVEELGNLVGCNPLERMRSRRLFVQGSRLETLGLIRTGTRSRFGHTRQLVGLTSRAVDTIFGQEEDTVEEGTLALSDNGPLQEREIRRNWNQLVLPADQLELLEQTLARFAEGTRDTLRAWGVVSHPGSGSGAHLPLPAGLRLLFSGPSGTGKTLCAEALAERLGRRLLVTDMGRLLSKWVGESQQNVSALFDDYTRIACATDRAPVLLLDECDQFLLARGVPDSGSEQMRHEMSNLFLERLDRVPGIVVATTNLVEVLDPAFSRRFDLKLVFPQPGPAERERIWRAHLPGAVPLLDPLPFGELAARFPFNGGRISLVMGNALARAAARGDGLASGDLLAAAQCELQGAFGDGAPRPMGFRPL
jgi:hypothetical protein